MIFRQAYFMNFRISDGEIRTLLNALETYKPLVDDLPDLSSFERKLIIFRINGMTRQLTKAEKYVDLKRQIESTI